MSKPWSIHSRLLLAASLVLTLFLGLGGFALEQAFESSAQRATEQRLLGHVYALLGAAQVDEQGRMRIPETLPDPRLSNTDSGLYAVVSGEGGNYQWRSGSLLGRALAPADWRQPGVPLFEQVDLGEQGFYRLAYSLLWEDDQGQELRYTLTIAEHADVLDAQVVAFRDQLLLWLGGVALVLLLIQGVVLTWGLRPLRQVSHDLQQVERGRVKQLQGHYPAELQGLTDNINSLIIHSQESRDRYRNSLGDLAHSLKTPLAVLQGSLDELPVPSKNLVQEQVSRMDQIVQVQLKRAVADGRQVGANCQVAGVVRKLVSSLDKVYRDYAINTVLELDEAARFSGDEGDLMELLGNIIENAYKYGESRVRVTASQIKPTSASPGLRIEVEDDGSGIDESIRDDVLNRGIRADQSQPGQGIGLGVSQDIVQLYKGELRIGDSELGGASIVVEWPPRVVN